MMMCDIRALVIIDRMSQVPHMRATCSELNFNGDVQSDDARSTVANTSSSIKHRLDMIDSEDGR